MATSEEKILIEIELDDGKLAKGFVDAKKVAGRSGAKAGEEFSSKANASAKRGLSGIKTALAGIAGAFATAFAVREVTEAAKIQENAINEINTALKLSGQFTRQASLDFQNFASTLQQNSVIGDEVILQNAALIQNLGKLSVEGLKPATQAALDMAAALKIDLRAAATLVGKAAAGEVSSFTRYGVVIEKGKTQAETFANTLAALNKNFGGAAAAQLNTYDGAISQLSNTWGDLKEEIGFLITTSPVVIGAFKVITERVSELIKGIKDYSGTKENINEISNAFITLGFKINDYVIAPFEFLYNTTNFVFSAIKTGLQGVITAIASYYGKVADILQSVGVDNDFTRGIRDFRDSSQEIFDEMATNTKESMNKVFDFSFSDSSRALVEEIAAVAETVNTQAERIPQGLAGAMSKSASEVNKGAKKISTIVTNGIVRVVASSIEQLGANLVKGGSLFDNFGNFIIGLMGDLAVQVGTAILVTGQAIEVLRNSILTAIGIPAIAAGIALIALGGAMKAYASQNSAKTNNASVGVQTGGESYGNDTTQSQVTSEQPELEERRAAQNVHFHGEILGDERSAERIVEYIKIAQNNGAIA